VKTLTEQSNHPYSNSFEPVYNCNSLLRATKVGAESMEHRCDHRKLLTLEIVLNDRHTGEILARTRNVSLSGMLVDIGKCPVALDTIVEVSFPVGCGELSRDCTAKALVVHQNNGRIGLMFSEADTNVRQILRKLLYGYATPAQRAHLDLHRQVVPVSRAVA
jgi:hypothetical protein